MNIVSTTKKFGMEGLGAAFSISNINFLLWNIKEKPALDMFHEIKPDIIFYDESNPAFPIARNKYPNCHFWDIKERPIKPRANVVQYLVGKKKEIYECDVGAFSYNWEDIDLTPLIEKGLRIRIWGNKRLPTPFYVGELPLGERKHALASAKSWISFNEEEEENATINGNLKQYLVKDNKLVEWNLCNADYTGSFNNTYNHLASEILTELNFEKEAKECLTALSTLYEKHKLKI